VEVSPERRARLNKFTRALNTDDGKALMDEVRAAWGGDPTHSNPIMCGKNIGLGEALKQLEEWQRGLPDE